jgi:glycolate oxidase FAD binding subunit
MSTPIELVEQVRAASAAARPLRIRGGGTKDFYGGPLRGDVLDTRAWSGICIHEPSELYITARAGTPLGEVEALLASQRQILASEPPHFGPGATVGGCVAAGLSGPRRFAAGPVSGSLRDHVLGAQLLDGRGRVLRFGGTVIKNVAGYDVSRLLAGSLGQLGLLLEITLKVLPAPEAECTLRFECDEQEALSRLSRWRSRPLPLSASLWMEGLLWARLSGSAAALRHARAQLGGESLEDAQGARLWGDLREHRLPLFTAGRTTWRIGVPDTAAPLELDGAQAIEGGGLRWLATELPASDITARARALGGHATRFRNGDRADAPFAALSAAQLAIHRRLKDEFDPGRIFNPARMHPDL